MGPISLSGDTEEDLVNFPRSHYADPPFSWVEPVAPTDMELTPQDLEKDIQTIFL